MSHKIILGTAAAGRLNSGKAIVRLFRDCLAGGLRSFDTAPLYGSGAIEGLLAEALTLQRAGDEVTVNTKFGQPAMHRLPNPARFYLPNKLAVGLSRRLGISRSGRTGIGNVSKEAEMSLKRSLQIFGTGRVDVFFAHEVPVSEMDHPEFISFIRSAKSEGRIRRFGLGGYRRQYCSEGSGEFWDAVDVLQVESIPGIRPSAPSDWKGEIFLHGVLAAVKTISPRPEPAEALREAISVQGAAKVLVGVSRHEHLHDCLSWSGELPE